MGTACQAVGTGCEAVGALFEAVGALFEAVGTSCEAAGALFEAVGTGCEAVGTLFEAVGTSCEAVGTLFEAVGTGCEAKYRLFTQFSLLPLAIDDNTHGMEQYFYIEAEGYVFDVEYIIFEPLDHLLYIGGISVFYLPPRGNTWLYFLQMPDMGGDFGDFFEVKKAFGARADQRHISTEYVPKLWQLVQPIFAHNFAPAGNARVAIGRKFGPFGFGISTHRPKFINHKRAALIADAFLGVENRTFGGEPNAEANKQINRAENQQKKTTRAYIYRPFEQPKPRRNQLRVDFHQYRAVQMLKFDFAQQNIVHTRYYLDKQVIMRAQNSQIFVDLPMLVRF